MRPLPSAAVLSRMRRLRWTAFVLLSGAYVLSSFHRIAPAALAGELRAAFSASGAQLGAIAAAYFWAYTVMQVPTGILVDTIGPRRVSAAGGVLAGAGAIVFGLAGSLPAALAGRTLVGLGVSVTFVAMLKLVTAWFREREFATLSGLVMFMGNLGAIASAAPLAWIVARVPWRSVFVAAGLSSLAGAALTWALVRDAPGEAGLPSIRELDGEPPHAPRGRRWAEGLLAVLRNRATWPGFFLNLGIAGAFLSFAGLWAVPYLTHAHGMTRERAAWHTTAMLAAFAVGSLATGKLSDRVGRRKPLVVGLGAGFVLSWLPWLAGARPPLAASVALFAAMGACAAAFTLSWASVKEVNPPALSGTAMSVVNTGVFLGPTVYQPLVGWVVDRHGHGAGLLVLWSFAAAGLVAALLLRETRCRNVAAER